MTGHPIRDVNEGIEHALHLDARRKLRIVAIVDIVKAVGILLLGVGILSAEADALEHGGSAMFRLLNIDPTLTLARQLLALLHAADDQHALLMGAAVAYASLRFVESYGLWRMRNWARWLGLVSAGIYVPFEVYYLSVSPSLRSAGLLSINLAVLWLLWPRARLSNASFPG